MKNKKILGAIIGALILIIVVIVCVYMINKKDVAGEKYKDEEVTQKNDVAVVHSDKEKINELFNNFPEINNVYYTSKNAYSERDVGPTIYQIDILAKLTDNGYNKFIKDAELQEVQNYDMTLNPNGEKYSWKEIKNTQIIESKNGEDASITKIYVDEGSKTIYIIALGGN